MSWAGKVATLADRYTKGAEDLTVRSRLLLKWLEQQGRIVTNCDAEYTYFSVLKGEPPVEGHGEAGVINFARHNLWDQAKLGWRGYVGTDLMYEQEKMQAKGDAVIVKRYARIMPNLTNGMRNKIRCGFRKTSITGRWTGCPTKRGNACSRRTRRHSVTHPASRA